MVLHEAPTVSHVLQGVTEKPTARAELAHKLRLERLTLLHSVWGIKQSTGSACSDVCT